MRGFLLVSALTFAAFPEDALDLGRGGGLSAVEELPVSLLLGRVELGERAENRGSSTLIKKSEVNFIGYLQGISIKN